uniref:MULE transposase domain-containing protein n=1 Tax=Arundo donax TaxID=35708 RepID=A0A0A9HM18_ARUDO
MFVALKLCIDGFLNGCRLYLGVDSTVLIGKWRGQLASAIAVDDHNWMFPIAYVVLTQRQMKTGSGSWRSYIRQ